jgi:hypothetical protein
MTTPTTQTLKSQAIASPFTIHIGQKVTTVFPFEDDLVTPNPPEPFRLISVSKPFEMLIIKIRVHVHNRPPKDLISTLITE